MKRSDDTANRADIPAPEITRDQLLNEINKRLEANMNTTMTAEREGRAQILSILAELHIDMSNLRDVYMREHERLKKHIEKIGVRVGTLEKRVRKLETR